MMCHQCVGGGCSGLAFRIRLQEDMPREELEDIDGNGADEGEEWELVAEREWHDSVQRRPQALLTGEWSTPSVDKASLAPGCRIQRRTPVRNFQAHCHFYGQSYSKCFTWAVSGSPTMEDMLLAAVERTWQEYEKACGA